MRVVTLLMCLWSAGAVAGITAADLAAWKKLDYHSFEDDPGEEGQVAALLTRTTGAGLPAAANSLAKQWGISPEAAQSVFEVVISQDTWSWDHDAKPRARLEAAFDRALSAAPESRQVWSMRVRWLTQTGACDPQSRDRFFALPVASDFLEMEVCPNWLPEFARRHPRDLAALDELRQYIRKFSAADALALNEIERDVLAAPADRAPDDLQLYLLRAQIVALQNGDLGARVLEFVDRLPPAWHGDFFNREIRTDVRAGEHVVARSGIFEIATIEDARVAWIVALFDAGRAEEARAAIASFDLPHGTVPYNGSPGRGPRYFATDGADSAEFLRDLVAPTPGADLFERYVGNGHQGLLWGPASDSDAARRLGAKMLRAHGLPSPAAFLEKPFCGYPVSDDDQKPDSNWRDAMPAVLRERSTNWGAQLDAARQRLGCGPPEARSRTVSTRLPAFKEVPLSADARRAKPVPNYAGQIPLPEGFTLVRAERQGARIAALCQSSAVDPAGEVGRGGYWLLLSTDGSKFGEPLYLGFQAMQPYVLTEKARVPLLAGDALHIEAQIRELDPDSITFPPVGLRARRSVADLYLDIPLAAIERDRDHDGLSDLLEERIATNPDNPDTDGDGIYDGADDLPQVPARGAANPIAGLVAEVLKQIAGFSSAAIIEPLRDGESPGASPTPLLTGLQRGDGAWYFTFIEGDAAMFTGVQLGKQTALVLDAAQVRELNAKFGPTYPLAFPQLLVDEKMERAIVSWSAQWTGGTLRFTRKNGKWVKEVISQWIT